MNFSNLPSRKGYKGEAYFGEPSVLVNRYISCLNSLFSGFTHDMLVKGFGENSKRGEGYRDIRLPLIRPNDPWESNFNIQMVEMPDFEIKSIRFGPSRTQELSFEPWWEYIGVMARLEKTQ